MSMLAERRRKTRYVINPTRKPLWTTDSSGIKFGKELMEKMGWSAGKGLGAKEQGIQEPLRVSYKNDNKGMGFKGNEENWIEYQDEFNSLLNQLASKTESRNITTNEEEKNGVMSLEEKSKLSKARVHYQKFTRGKDLSKYSENDLSCILGTGKKKKVEEIVEQETLPDNNTYETSFGVTTINSGSIKDYFKKKWALNNVKSENSNVDQTENGFDEENQIIDEAVGEKKSKKRLRESEQELENENVEDLETKKHKKKRRKRDSEEESMSKKDSKAALSEDDTKLGKNELQNGEIENEVPNDCTVDVECKKKKKKKRDSKGLEETESSSLDLKNQTEVDGEIKHKKKKKEKESEEKPECKDEELISENLEQNHLQENSSKKKKKKKKDKKEETDNNCEMTSGDLSVMETNNDYVTVEIESGKKKKKKEKKPQDSNENNCDKKSDDNVEEVLVKKKKKKKDKEMESLPVKNDNSPGTDDPDTNSESVVKEEKKKKKKLKENFENQVNGDFVELEVTNVTVEESSSKRKKKKEDLKTAEGENKIEEIPMELPEEEIVENVLPKKKKKKRDKEITEAVNEAEEIKKKSKKSKKEKIDEETELKEDCQNALESHEKISKKKKQENKPESSDADASETTKEENKVGVGEQNNKVGETLIHSHKTELFKMKKPFLDDVKRYSTAKAMNLFCDAEINKFKGSNLENIPGYGFRKEIKNTVER